MTKTHRFENRVYSLMRRGLKEATSQIDICRKEIERQRIEYADDPTIIRRLRRYEKSLDEIATYVDKTKGASDYELCRIFHAGSAGHAISTMECCVMYPLEIIQNDLGLT